MYDIHVTSNENQLSDLPFQTSIIITTDNSKVEKQLTQILSQDDYFLTIYQNPIFWFVNFSPMYVYIRKYESDTVSSNQLIKMNEEIIFSFKRKIHRKYFENVVTGVLTKFFDKKLADLKKEENYLHTEESFS